MKQLTFSIFIFFVSILKISAQNLEFGKVTIDELKEKIDLVNSDRRILLVDDEPYNIMGLKIQLMQTEYKDIISKVDQAFNGLEAI